MSTLLLVLLLSVIPLGLCLAPDIASENGPIEWGQVAILVIGCVTAIGAYFYGIGNSSAKRLFLCSVPFWLILISRELSWGRVFYPNGKGGFLSLKQLWYGPYVYPGIAIVLALIAAYMIKNDLHKEVVYWLKNAKLPAVDGIILLIAVVGADLSEHSLAGLIGLRHGLFEELAEMVAYIALVSLTVNLGFYAKFQPKARNPFYIKRGSERNY
ncbi:MAG: hypothetical protein K0Q77_1515 [Anaerosporomusa subterranea]|nr:hypothetical protein [Anaerosporomusa subterranea]